MGNVLYINKPKGMSSFDVCFKLRKVLNTRKIGHTGTLDPNASGVMIVLADKATKAGTFLVADHKEYKCRIRLGIRTDTLDIDGNILEEKEYVLPEIEKITTVLDSFLGTSRQEVPLTSAIKVNGKRLYQYQLEGKEVELPIREIRIDEIRLLEMHEDGFTFSCSVSSGTYIRSLARDILDRLGLIGTVLELERTAVGEVRISDCDDLDQVLAGHYQTHDIFDLLSRRYPVVECEDLKSVRNGKPLKLTDQGETILLASGKEALAIYKREAMEYRCVRGLW